MPFSVSRIRCKAALVKCLKRQSPGRKEKEERMKEIRDKRKKVICQLMEDELYVPMNEKELAAFMQVKPEDRPEFSQILNELVLEGRLQLTKRGKYIRGNRKAEGITGTFISNPRGFGFVEVEGLDQDLYIPESGVNHAFHMDKVQVALLETQNGKRQEAKITAVLSHGLTQVVGTYDNAGNFGFVIPDNDKILTDIFIAKEDSKGAVTGHKVVVKLLSYGDDAHKPEGKITEILGHVNDPGVDILSIVKGFEIPMEFSEKMLNQAGRIAKPVSEGDMAGRKDLRDMQMVTIDGEDAKDLDDAVSLSAGEGKYFLGVHIADVSNYVQENSALDREARERGTSVYLVDRVIPMLPHALSNGICSLNQGEERLALSCLMTIDKKGEVVDYEIAESVINVNQRMSYTDVNSILEGDEETTEKFRELAPMFFLMKELSDILRKKRKARGSIDFDFPESKIILDKDGTPLSVEAYERNAATNIIEDFMLLANETVAEHFYWMEIPFLYRTHDNPDPEKIAKLGTFINNFGYYLKLKNGGGRTISEIHPKEIQKLLDKIEGSDEEAMISRLTLRSMKRAQYSVDCTGHFGLACQYYCHFTSPIRRYPDLQIHRIIREQLRGKLTEERIAHYQEILPEVAKHSSETERRADEAERETEKLKKVQYIEQRIGQTFEGVISGITAWGIYVELPDTVEGMIHVSKLAGDYFYYEEETYEMVGRDSGMRYKLGQKVAVTVDGVDYFQKSIDFILADTQDSNV